MRLELRLPQSQGWSAGGRGVQFKLQVGWARCGAMFDAQAEVLLFFAQIQVGIAPGMQVGAASQCLSGALGGGFAGVMDDSHCGMEAPLQVSQRIEDGGDFSGDVFIDAVQSGQRVQDQQSRLNALHGLEQQLSVMIKVESQLLGIEDLDVETLEADAAGLRDAVQPVCDDAPGVFCGEQQHRSGMLHGEALQARFCRRDGDCQMQCEKRLAAFRLAADDADCLLQPQRFDQPVGLGFRWGHGCRCPGVETVAGVAPAAVVRGVHRRLSAQAFSTCSALTCCALSRNAASSA